MDGRVGHHLPVLPDQVEWNVVDHVALAVCQGMSFDKTLQVGFLGRCRELRQPEKLLHDNYGDCIRIPMLENMRSLNLSNSVAIIAYEVLRQFDFEGLQGQGHLTQY